MATYNFTSNANIPWSTLAVGDVLNCNNTGTEITLTNATSQPITFAIVADGGKGGNLSDYIWSRSFVGGYGNRVSAILTIEPNSILKLMRGANGGNISVWSTVEYESFGGGANYGGGACAIGNYDVMIGACGGGGGASYLYVDNVLVLVAAGGNGAYANGNYYDASNGETHITSSMTNGASARNYTSDSLYTASANLGIAYAGGGGGARIISNTSGSIIYASATNTARNVPMPYVNLSTLSDVSITSNTTGATVFSLTVLSIGDGKTARVNVGGEWKEATPWVNVGGLWKKATPWVKVNGVWKKTIV